MYAKTAEANIPKNNKNPATPAIIHIIIFFNENFFKKYMDKKQMKTINAANVSIVLT